VTGEREEGKRVEGIRYISHSFDNSDQSWTARLASDISKSGKNV
jgi:hypothetical protein